MERWELYRQAPDPSASCCGVILPTVNVPVTPRHSNPDSPTCGTRRPWPCPFSVEQLPQLTWVTAAVLGVLLLTLQSCWLDIRSHGRPGGKAPAAVAVQPGLVPQVPVTADFPHDQPLLAQQDTRRSVCTHSLRTHHCIVDSGT